MNAVALYLTYIEAILKEFFKKEYPLKEIAKQSKSSLMRCANCENDFPYAEPNKSDGSFICYGCRSF